MKNFALLEDFNLSIISEVNVSSFSLVEHSSTHSETDPKTVKSPHKVWRLVNNPHKNKETQAFPTDFLTIERQLHSKLPERPSSV